MHIHNYSVKISGSEKAVIGLIFAAALSLAVVFPFSVITQTFWLGCATFVPTAVFLWFVVPNRAPENNPVKTQAGNAEVLHALQEQARTMYGLDLTLVEAGALFRNLPVQHPQEGERVQGLPFNRQIRDRIHQLVLVWNLNEWQLHLSLFNSEDTVELNRVTQPESVEP